MAGVSGVICGDWCVGGGGLEKCPTFYSYSSCNLRSHEKGDASSQTY